MRIAHIAPPWIQIPPKQYGGTENVIYHLVEELVAQGHDVTLFAPGDSKTSAKLVSFYPKSLLETGVSWSMHLKAFFHLQKQKVSSRDTSASIRFVEVPIPHQNVKVPPKRPVPPTTRG